MRVLVCGGREYENKKELYNFLYDFCIKRGLKSEEDEYGNWLPAGLTIIHGDARGADRLADDWAVINWVPVEAFPAEWQKNGRKAGPIRNHIMLKSGVDVVIAAPGGRGTEHMKNIARAAGVEVLEIG
jgi:hypothetical protein